MCESYFQVLPSQRNPTMHYRIYPRPNFDLNVFPGERDVHNPAIIYKGRGKPV